MSVLYIVEHGPIKGGNLTYTYDAVGELLNFSGTIIAEIGGQTTTQPLEGSQAMPIADWTSSNCVLDQQFVIQHVTFLCIGKTGNVGTYLVGGPDYSGTIVVDTSSTYLTITSAVINYNYAGIVGVLAVHN